MAYGIGSTVGGRYRLEEILGRGATADVFRAVDETGAVQAVKILRTTRLESPSLTIRFEREIRTIGALDGVAHVVHLRDEGAVEGHSFMVVDAIEGDDVQAMIHTFGPLDVGKALEIARDIAGVLSAAHERRIVHRDVKPANIVVDPERGAVLTDFGLAFETDEAERLTGHVLALGTPAYAAPEQLSAHDADARSDIYSLGATLYAMLVGLPPHVGDYDTVAKLKRQRRHVPWPSSHRDEVPLAVDKIVRRALAPSPDERYQTSESLRADLDAVIRGEPIRSVAKPKLRTRLAARWHGALALIEARDPISRAVQRVARLLVVAGVPFLVFGMFGRWRLGTEMGAMGGLLIIAGFRGSRLEVATKVGALAVVAILMSGLWHEFFRIGWLDRPLLWALIAIGISVVIVYVVGIDRAWARVPTLILLSFFAVGSLSSSPAGTQAAGGAMVAAGVAGAVWTFVVLSLWQIEPKVKSGRRLGPLRRRTTAELIDLGVSGRQVVLLGSARRNLDDGAPSGSVESTFVVALSALMNVSGGAVVVGVTPTGEVVGAEGDLESFDESGSAAFEYWTLRLIVRTLGDSAASSMSITFPTHDGKTVVRVGVIGSSEPVIATTRAHGEVFCIHRRGRVEILGLDETVRYISRRWDVGALTA